MITPLQNAEAMDELDIWYFINDYDEDAKFNIQTLKEKTKALIKCDRRLQQFEEHNWNMASTHRRNSIHLKILKMWGTKK